MTLPLRDRLAQLLAEACHQDACWRYLVHEPWLRAADALIASEEWRGMARGLVAVRNLIEESHGVAGLHLNGDVAPWDELRTGGRFEDWLRDFDAALARLRNSDAS